MDVRFFGYWSGKLPSVTQLHFRSFVHHHPGAHYELWLDTDAASVIEAPELAWLKSHANIHVRPFSLNALIEKHVTGGEALMCFDRRQGLKKLGRKLHRAGLFGPVGLQSWRHPQFGRTYRHDSPLFAGFQDNKAYRGDLARCLIALEHYQQACLYVDLDICFTSDLRTLCGPTAFSYRWESYGFANSAVLYLPSPQHSGAWAARGRELQNFLPWILFAEENCQALGLDMHPSSMFDPLWTPGSVLQGDTARFFGPNAEPERMLARVQAEGFRAIHWHNNWKTVPAASSVYASLLASMA